MVDFSDLSGAFAYKSDDELRRSRRTFTLFQYPLIVAAGPVLTSISLKLKLPVKPLIKAWVFDQFCGGEDIEECTDTVHRLSTFGVGSILDYSVEGVEDETSYIDNAEEIKRTILKAAEGEELPFAVFKVTGIGRFELLEKLNEHEELSEEETLEFTRLKERLEDICQTAYDYNISVFVDAEETWIQEAIDRLVYEMMEKYNRDKAIVWNTIQCYRRNGLDLTNAAIARGKAANYRVGLKLVRGAYMEKERARAESEGYESPINDTIDETHRTYNDSIRACFEAKNWTSMCAGTHNEDSCNLLIDLMESEAIEPSDKRFWFAQLYGMSDNLTFNLAREGYNAAKYLPYGPIESVIPYLSRRADENSSVRGQASRELKLIKQELKRRKNIG
jgi:proline dehydrogenase